MDKNGRVITADTPSDPGDEHPKMQWQSIVLVLLSLVFGIVQWIANRELATITGRITRLEATVTNNNSRLTALETLLPRLRERIEMLEEEERRHRELMSRVEILLDNPPHGGGI